MERIAIRRCKKGSLADLTQCVVVIDEKPCNYIARLPKDRYGPPKWFIRNDPARRRFATKEDAALAVLADHDARRATI